MIDLDIRTSTVGIKTRRPNDDRKLSLAINPPTEKKKKRKKKTESDDEPQGPSDERNDESKAPPKEPTTYQP